MRVTGGHNLRIRNVRNAIMLIAGYIHSKHGVQGVVVDSQH